MPPRLSQEDNDRILTLLEGGKSESPDRPLPASPDAERLVLGSILRNSDSYLTVAAALTQDDFALLKHQRIFTAMGEVYGSGERIEEITLIESLTKRGWLQSVDGMGYIADLTEGVPEIVNLPGYVKIVKKKSLLRKLAHVGQNLTHRALLSEDDPEDILASTEDTLLRIGDSRTSETLLDAEGILGTIPGGVQSFLDPTKRARGLSTGFQKLDEMTGGLHEGELFILAARPSMGKTALAMNIAQHVAVELGKVVAVFSLEMSGDSLLTRVCCSLARIDQQKYRAGYLNHEERHSLQSALSQIVDSKLLIDDSSGARIVDIHAKLKRVKAERGLDLVVIDYLQLMSSPGENRNQQVSAISRGLKLLAKDLRVPMIVLSQLSRNSEQRGGDHKPILSDLRDSGSIEQDADLVAFIYREEVYKPDREDLKGVAELILAKQRNGPIGKVRLVFLKHCTRFENCEWEPEVEG